jgi:Tol biopolymer transport system component
MKKLLLSSIVLFLFSASIMMFQVSCQKDANARINGTTQQNKIIYTKSSSGITEIWIANIDGTNPTKVPISLPSNLYLVGEATITPDGNKVVFQARENSPSNTGYLYTCNTDGTGVTKILGDGSLTVYYQITAY